MKYANKIIESEYVDVKYYQHHQSFLFKVSWNICAVICFLLLLPFILSAKLSNILFKTYSELLSVLPSLLGFIMRYVFYKFTLNSCGKNVLIDFGTIFYYRRISIGNNVTFGIGNIVQHCDFGDNVLVSDGCRFVGGTRKHDFGRTDIPIVEQGGQMKKVKVNSDTWIDVNSVIMENVGQGCVVCAGSVVSNDIPSMSICSGNPAKIIGTRGEVG